MRNTRRAALVVAAVALAPIGPFAAAGVAGASTSVVHTVLSAGCGLDHQLGRSHCFAQLLGDAAGQPLATAAPTSGYGPADLQSAYSLAAAAASNGGTQTVAIVDAYDDSTAEADLGVYRSTYGLPPCTTANGCFNKVNQNGVHGSYPTNNQGWGLEVSLDLDMVSAACPKCHILLVEASSN